MKQEPISLLASVEAFLERHNMPPTTFGAKAVNDAKLVANLRSGADIRTRTADRIREFMEGYESAPPLSRGRSRRVEVRA